LNSLMNAAISMDVDTLESIYKGQGSRRTGGYTHAEMRIGLENFSRFLEPYRAKATLFTVGNDYRYLENIEPIRAMYSYGHEIANHTFSHAQGFRLLTPEQKENELAEMEDICEKTIGVRPRGFRSPGWNISDDALPILKRRGYIYDSSIFPTSVMPILKMMHKYTMRRRNRADQTTMGNIKYMFADPKPYITGLNGFLKHGQNGIVEFPVTVTPIFRIPFFATFLVSTGMGIFYCSLESLKFFRFPIQFQFHLSDFVDYSHPDLEDQVPIDGQGQYVPYALRMSLNSKIDLFRKALDQISSNHEFHTLADWGKQIFNSGDK
jgi:peptidoglycan-N-acetylglucosamine deacetylase